MTLFSSSENGSPVEFYPSNKVGTPLDNMASSIRVAAATPRPEGRSGCFLDCLHQQVPVGVAGAIVGRNVLDEYVEITAVKGLQS